MDLEEWIKHLKQGKTGYRDTYKNRYKYLYNKDTGRIDYYCIDRECYQIDSQTLEWYRNSYLFYGDLCIATNIFIGGE